MSTSTRRYTLLGVVAGMLVVLLGYAYIITFYEKVTEWQETGYQGEAARNPLLAAERLLARMGIPVRGMRFLPLDNLPMDEGDTLLLWQEQSNLRPLQITPLLEWVEAGGHLVMSGYAYQENKHEKELDPLLAALKVHLYLSTLERKEENTGLHPVELGGKTLQVRFEPAYFLKSERLDIAWRIPNKEGDYLQHFRYGAGSVSVVTDLNSIRNRHIGEHDNAEFLWRLLHYPGKVHQVWLLFPGHSGMPPLWELLWTHAWSFLLAAAPWLLLALWYAGARFGPLLPAPPRARRRLLEHIDASARLQWSTGQAAHLHLAVVQNLWERLEVRRPDWIHLPHEELVPRLAELIGMVPGELERVLRFSGVEEMPRHRAELEFTRQMRILARLYKQL